MDITDIMISFWVSYKGIFHRIEKINGSDVVLDKDPASNDSACISVDISECEPVCITPKILEESGFFCAKEKFLMGNGQSLLIVSWNEDSGDYSMSISLYDTSVTMRYVHELQMALKSHKRTDVIIDLRRDNMSLRPSNYVKTNGVTYKLLMKNEAGLWVIDKETDNIITESSLEKIMMTESILKDNKFTIKDGTYVYDDGNDNDFLIRYSNDEQWFIKNNTTDELFVGTIKYFHQLQNILSNVVHISIELVPQKTEKEIAEMMDDAFK